MKKLIQFIFFLFLTTMSSYSAPVSLGSYGCENGSDRFDNNLQIEFNFFVSGRASCRTDSRIYYWNFSTPQNITNSTFTLTLHIEGNNKNLNIKGRLLLGQLVNFTRVSSTRITGGDGRTWRRQVYEYVGSSSVGLMTRLEFDFNGTDRLDDFNLVVDSPLSVSSYLEMKDGDEDVAINFDTEDVLYENEKITNFILQGRFTNGEEGVVFALDPGVGADVYVECNSVTLVRTQISPVDQIGAGYEVECLPPTLSNDQRGLFKIRNIGSTPLTAVEFEVQMRSVPRILETARSINFNYQLFLNTGVRP